jgi:hypothetical protein
MDLRVPHALRFAGALAAVTTAVLTAGCPSGKCYFRFQEVDSAGRVKSDKCLLDTCPKGASFNDAAGGCQCEAPLVTLSGACVTAQEANASCGAAFTFQNGACVAKTCPPGQVLDAQSGACQSKQASDQAVAQNAGVTLKQGQTVGCPQGYTYVVNGSEGACVPNELTCGTGTRYEGGKCVAVTCAAGTVFDAATNQCVKLATTEGEKTFSVQAKLKASLGPDFCAPHARNPGGFGVQPGQSMTVKVTVSVQVPGNAIDQTQLLSVRTTNLGGAELTPQMYPGVTRINKQVQEQVVPGIRALGGKSIEPQATADVTCVIKRAPIQVIETHGGGV